KFSGDRRGTDPETRIAEIRCSLRATDAAQGAASLFQCHDGLRCAGAGSLPVCAGLADRGPGGDRGEDVDHRALSGTARDGGRVSQYRSPAPSRDILTTESPTATAELARC